ncbi:MAG: amidase family protein [Lautropia sp.]|nr:amidase family protein [Lautropia sp.]
MKEWKGRGAETLTAAYTNGRLSPVAVVEALFEQIDALDCGLGAMRTLYRDAALETARASEHRWKRRAPLSPLDGVPVTLREDFPLEGLESLRSGDDEAELASPVLERLHEAGCIILGTTVMSADDTLAAGLTADGRVLRNPWSPGASTGGSSAGAALACVAGYAPLHVAYDRFGSARLPAAFCGVFGFKPSQGRIPMAAPALGRGAAVLSRHVHDAAALMNILSRPDARDYTSLPPESTEYRMQVDGLSPKSLSIAVLGDIGIGLPVDPAVQKALHCAARSLQMAGATVEMIDSFMTPAMSDGIQRFLEAMAHADAQAGQSRDAGPVAAFIEEWRSWRAADFSGLEVMRAWQNIMAIRAAANQVMSGYDFLLMPTSPVLPYAAEALSPSGNPRDGLPHIGFTVPWNLAENPAATLNWGHADDGLPVGLQIVGHRFDDLGVLRLSRTLEIMRPEPEPWPCGA